MSIARDTGLTSAFRSSSLLGWTPFFCLAVIFLSWLPALSIGMQADDFYFYSPKVVNRPFSYFARDVLDNKDSLFLRPLPVLVYALESRLRFTAASAHALSIAIHLANTLLVAAFILMLVPGRGVRSLAFSITVAMLFFGCHPQSPGAVGWLGARFDVIGCFFGGLGLYFWIRSYCSPRRGTLLSILALVSLAAALLSKEPCIAFVAAAFAASFLERRSGGLARPAALAVLTVVYLIHRSIVLGGIGGHGVSHHTFNLASVWAYAVVDFWPAMPIPSAPSAATVGLVIAAATIILASKQTAAPGVFKYKNLIPPASLLVVSLALCVTFPMEYHQILRHCETRISYIHVFAIAIMLGCLLSRVPAGWATRACRVLFLFLLVAAIMLQQQWIGYWQEAGRTVQSILHQTQQLVPNPPASPTFVYWGVPLTTKRYCYVFGYGLGEALAVTYGRGDIKVVRYGGDEQKHRPTSNMFRFDYDRDRDELRLIPEWAR